MTKKLTQLMSQRSLVVSIGSNLTFRWEYLTCHSQLVQQEALTGLPVEKGIFTKEEFSEMVRVVNKGMKEKEKEKLNEWGKR
jgi:hypothetical protein